MKKSFSAPKKYTTLIPLPIIEVEFVDCTMRKFVNNKRGEK
jgi:hypothetical protein